MYRTPDRSVCVTADDKPDAGWSLNTTLPPSEMLDETQPPAELFAEHESWSINLLLPRYLSKSNN